MIESNIIIAECEFESSGSLAVLLAKGTVFGELLDQAEMLGIIMPSTIQD